MNRKGFGSSQKNLCRDQLHNIQNNLWFSYNPCDDLRFTKTKSPKLWWPSCRCATLSRTLDLIQMTVWSCWRLVKLRLWRDTVGRPYAATWTAICYTSGKDRERLSENFYDFTDLNIWRPKPPIVIPWIALDGRTQNPCRISCC